MRICLQFLLINRIFHMFTYWRSHAVYRRFSNPMPDHVIYALHKAPYIYKAFLDIQSFGKGLAIILVLVLIIHLIDQPIHVCRRYYNRPQSAIYTSVLGSSVPSTTLRESFISRKKAIPSSFTTLPTITCFWSHILDAFLPSSTKKN